MSLVAYDSSDCSEESDTENDNQRNGIEYGIVNDKHIVIDSNATKNNGTAATTTATSSHVASTSISDSDNRQHNTDINSVNPLRQSTTLQDSGQISDDDDDYVPGSSATTTTLQLPAPKHGNAVLVNNTNHAASRQADNDGASSLTLGLPAPKVQSRDNASLQSSDVAEEPLEELVKPKAAELASREKPPQRKKTTIKISLPSLAASDESDSDEETTSKKPRISKGGGSGLFALLPEPKHASKKEAGRVLLPHKMTRKAAAPKPMKPSGSVTHRPTAQVSRPSVPNPVKLTDAADSSDEDGDDTATANFFSIDSTAAGPQHVGGPMGLSERGLSSDDSGILSAASYAATSSLSTLPGVPRNQAPVQAPSPPPMDPNIGMVTDMPDIDSGQAEAMESSSYSTEWTGELGNQEEIYRLQGRRERGKEEINFIDVCADHGTNPLELTKNLTEETELHSHSRKNKEQPSSQQKRKHQITYLAHRAKEREFDLKNQWAQNRATKQQTQSKYGF